MSLLSWTSLSPHPLPTPPGHYRAPAGLPVWYSSVPLGIYFTLGSVHMSMLLSQFVPPSPSPTASSSPVSTSVYLFMPCKLFHQCHFPRFHISSVQSLSHVRFFATPWTAAHQASLSFTISWSLLKLMSIESVMPSNHRILCHPFLFLPSIFPSIRVFFQWVSSSHQVAKLLELQLQHQSFQWIFRTDLLYNWLVWSISL